MKRTLYIIGSLLLVVAAYFFTYRTSHLAQITPGDNESFRLVVAGIHFPWNSTTSRVYSAVYRPLIDHSANRIPTQNIEGEIRRVDGPAGELMISREGKDGILIHIPKSLEKDINALSTGDQIKATYGFRPMQDSPFCYSYELRSVARLASK